MASVRSRVPLQSSLFSSTPRLGRQHHQAYASSNVLQPPPSSLPPFRLPPFRLPYRPSPFDRAKPAVPPRSGSEVCRTWNNGRRTSGFSQCKRRHECARCHDPHRSLNCPSATVVHTLAPVRSGASPYARYFSVLHRATFYSVSSVLCVFPFLQCFPQLYCDSAASSCVLVSSLLYVFSSFGELDLPFAAVFLCLRCLLFLHLQPSFRSVSLP